MSNEVNVVPTVPTPTVEVYPDGSPIRRGAASAEFWPTMEKALEISKGRVKGARKVCTVKDPQGNVRFATTTHPHYLEEYILCTELGWEVLEVGKVPAAKAPVTADGILAAINALPNETEREAIKKQMAALLGLAI